jgi:hypothetical protein
MNKDLIKTIVSENSLYLNIIYDGVVIPKTILLCPGYRGKFPKLRKDLVDMHAIEHRHGLEPYIIGTGTKMYHGLQVKHLPRQTSRWVEDTPGAGWKQGHTGPCLTG